MSEIYFEKYVCYIVKCITNEHIDNLIKECRIVDSESECDIESESESESENESECENISEYENESINEFD